MVRPVAIVLILGVLLAPSIVAANSAARSDTEIMARVKTALIRHDATKAREINVETANGIVQLSGFANQVAGVTKVRNSIEVEAPP
jgi:osmotically-inducible protein OsmY